jgi:polyphosphate kinase 2 (PPK2 family)
MEQINFENIFSNGTIVLKFYCLSKEEQRKDYWEVRRGGTSLEFSAGDLKEENGMIIWSTTRRQSTDKTENAPWYVVPADDKDMCSLHAEIIWNEMKNILI